MVQSAVGQGSQQQQQTKIPLKTLTQMGPTPSLHSLTSRGSITSSRTHMQFQMKGFRIFLFSSLTQPWHKEVRALDTNDAREQHHHHHHHHHPKQGCKRNRTSIHCIMSIIVIVVYPTLLKSRIDDRVRRSSIPLANPRTDRAANKGSRLASMSKTRPIWGNVH